jgi:signal transduction histidine kinase
MRGQILRNNSPTALHNNSDTRTSGHYSADMAEAIIDKSDAQPVAEDERSQSHKSLVDSYDRLVKYVEKLEGSVDELRKRNDELNDFVSIGAHELKAPLMPILGIAELLELELGRQVKTKYV